MRQWEFQFMRVTPRVGNYIRINPMASWLEWLLYFWVEGDHCCIHVRLNLLCRSIVVYRQPSHFMCTKGLDKKWFALFIHEKSDLLLGLPWSLSPYDDVILTGLINAHIVFILNWNLLDVFSKKIPCSFFLWWIIWDKSLVVFEVLTLDITFATYHIYV
jgi:hypothetical protein